MNSMVIFNLLSVFAIIAFLVLALRAKTISTSFFDGRAYAICVFVIFAFAILVRVIGFGSIPGGMNQDEAMAAVDALALARHGTDRFGMVYPVHFTAWGFGQMSVLMSYIMAVFIKFFGLSEITTRLPMLITSLAGILALYLYTKESFGKRVALFALFLVAINPWHIMQSRWALDCNMFPHFILFSMYFIQKGLKKRRYLYLSMVFFALSMYSYGIAFYSIPILLVALCVYLLATKRIDMRDALICVGVYLAFAWPIFVLMFINLFKLPTIYTPWFTIPYFSQTVRTSDLLFFAEEPFSQAANNLYSLISVSFLQLPDLAWNSIDEFGPMYFSGSILLIAGFIAQGKQKVKGFAPVFLLIWLAVAVFACIIVNGVNINRANIIFYPLIMFCAIGLTFIFERLDSVVEKTTLLGIFVLSFVLFTGSYFTTQNKEISRSFFDGFGDSIVLADNSKSEKIYISSNLIFDDFAILSEILTMFYLDIDAEYFQGKVTEKTSYTQRYVYYSMNTLPEDAASSSFVFKLSELWLFSENDFDFFFFNEYGVAIPKT